MSTSSFAEYLVEQLDALIYLVDLQTYEVLYINEMGKKLFGPGQVVGQPCYRVLQGRDAPCPFCTTARLTKDAFHVWEYTNPLTGRHYLLKDKLAEWRGKTVRLEVAMDITEKENVSRGVRNKLEMQRALVDCVRTFYAASNFNEAIVTILRIVGQIHQADRAYIFEYAGNDQGRTICKNTHEWCAEGVEPQIDKLQSVTIDLLPDWSGLFHENKALALARSGRDQGEPPASLQPAEAAEDPQRNDRAIECGGRCHRLHRRGQSPAHGRGSFPALVPDLFCDHGAEEAAHGKQHPVSESI